METRSSKGCCSGFIRLVILLFSHSIDLRNKGKFSFLSSRLFLICVFMRAVRRVIAECEKPRRNRSVGVGFVRTSIEEVVSGVFFLEGGEHLALLEEFLQLAFVAYENALEDFEQEEAFAQAFWGCFVFRELVAGMMDRGVGLFCEFTHERDVFEPASIRFVALAGLVDLSGDDVARLPHGGRKTADGFDGAGEIVVDAPEECGVVCAVGDRRSCSGDREVGDALEVFVGLNVRKVPEFLFAHVVDHGVSIVQSAIFC